MVTRPLRAKSVLLRCWNSLGIWRRSFYSGNLSRGGREIGETTVNKEKGDYFRIKPNGDISCVNQREEDGTEWWLSILFVLMSSSAPSSNKSIQQLLPNPPDYEVTRLCGNQPLVPAPSSSKSKPLCHIDTVCVDVYKQKSALGWGCYVSAVYYLLLHLTVKDRLSHLGH